MENRYVTALFSELNGVVLFCLFSTFPFFVWTVVWENVHGFLSSRTIHTSVYNSNFVFYLSVFVYVYVYVCTKIFTVVLCKYVGGVA
jgi:hypothetical protein